MKNKILLISLLLMTLVIGIKDAFAADSDLGKNSVVFTICDAFGDKCQSIYKSDINTNQTYDNFELKSGKIYLNNANIQMKIYDEVELNITGKNKITNFINTTDNGISIGESYIPFTVEGDGILEIENYNKYNTNNLGEIYYSRWQEIAPAYKLVFCKLDKLMNSEVILTIPESGWTISDIANYIDNNICNETQCYGVLSSLHNDIDIDIETYIGEPFNVTENIPVDFSSFDIYRDFLKDEYLHSNELTNDDIVSVDAKTAIEYFINHDMEKGQRIEAIHPITKTVNADMEWADNSVDTDLSVSLTKACTLLIGEEPVELVNIMRDDNIILEAPKGINSVYLLKVESILDKVAKEEMEKIEEKTKKPLLALYDINILDENNEIVKLTDGNYKIRIKIDELIKSYENFIVIYIDDENNIEEIDATTNDDYVEFTTSHLSKYGIIGTSKMIDTKSASTEVVTNPKTLDSIYLNVVAFISLGFIISVAIVKLKGIKLRSVK